MPSTTISNALYFLRSFSFGMATAYVWGSDRDIGKSVHWKTRLHCGLVNEIPIAAYELSAQTVERVLQAVGEDRRRQALRHAVMDSTEGLADADKGRPDWEIQPAVEIEAADQWLRGGNLRQPELLIYGTDQVAEWFVVTARAIAHFIIGHQFAAIPDGSRTAFHADAAINSVGNQGTGGKRDQNNEGAESR